MPTGYRWRSSEQQLHSSIRSRHSFNGIGNGQLRRHRIPDAIQPRLCDVNSGDVAAFCVVNETLSGDGSDKMATITCHKTGGFRQVKLALSEQIPPPSATIPFLPLTGKILLVDASRTILTRGFQATDNPALHQRDGRQGFQSYHPGSGR